LNSNFEKLIFNTFIYFLFLSYSNSLINFFDFSYAFYYFIFLCSELAEELLSARGIGKAHGR